MEPYYEQDGCTIYHGDCREILPQLEPVGLLATDPPYGINHASHKNGAPLRGKAIVGDTDTSIRDSVLRSLSTTPFLVFAKWRYPPTHAAVRGVMVWDKGGHVGQGDLSFPWKQNFELVFAGGSGFKGRRGPGILRHLAIAPWSRRQVHPHEKPVSLLMDLLSKHEATTILDPFMGSGTTLVAAKLLNRRAIGIEIEERYCEIAANRLRQKVFQFTGG